MAAGRAREAIGHYQRALELKPDSAEAHYDLACVLAGREEFNEAIVHYRKALDIKPGYLDARNNLGTYLLCIGQVDEAIVELRKVLKADPNHSGGSGGRSGTAGAVTQEASRTERAVANSGIFFTPAAQRFGQLITV